MAGNSEKVSVKSARGGGLLAWLVAALLLGAFFTAFSFLPFLWNLALGALLVAAGILVFTVRPRPAASGETEFAASRPDFQSVVANLEDAVVIYDRDFRIIFFNSAAERLFRLEREDVLGQAVQPQSAEDPARRLLVQVLFPSLAPTVILRSRANEYPEVVDISFSDPPLELRVRSVPVSGAGGEPAGFMKVVNDRTREVLLLKSKTEFLTVASHQLRSPATDINWALQSLAGEKGLSEAGQAVLQSATAASRELLKVIEDLLNVSRIEEGHFGYKFESKDITAFIDGILSQVAAAARRAGIKVYFDRPKETLPPVNVDPQKLGMALDNLLGNAVRYNVENGEVVVRAQKQPDEPFVEVSVRDTGIGIPTEDTSKLFRKFFRSENAVKSQPEGSGLGLYITKNIIQAHGGRVWVESEPGRGSTFHFTLPTDPSLIPQHEVATEE